MNLVWAALRTLHLGALLGLNAHKNGLAFVADKIHFPRKPEGKKLFRVIHACSISLALLGCEQAAPDVITLTRIYAKDEAELKRYCGDDLVIEPLGCARGGAMRTPKSSHCTIYLLKPRGFDDHERLRTQGHEVHHCFEGAKHT